MGAISRTAMPASLNISLHVHATHAAHVGHAVAVAAALLLFHQLRHHRVGGEHQAGYGRGVLQRRASDLGRVDRKSTRLNSSHSQISYAVFCLKKKKKERTEGP